MQCTLRHYKVANKLTICKYLVVYSSTRCGGIATGVGKCFVVNVQRMLEAIPFLESVGGAEEHFVEARPEAERGE